MHRLALLLNGGNLLVKYVKPFDRLLRLRIIQARSTESPDAAISSMRYQSCYMHFSNYSQSYKTGVPFGRSCSGVQRISYLKIGNPTCWKSLMNILTGICTCPSLRIFPMCLIDSSMVAVLGSIGYICMSFSQMGSGKYRAMLGNTSCGPRTSFATA